MFVFFYTDSLKILIQIDLVQVRKKRQNWLTKIVHKSSPKSIGFLREYIQMYVYNFSDLQPDFDFFLKKPCNIVQTGRKTLFFFSQKFWCQCPDLQRDFEFSQLYPDVQQAFLFSSKMSSDTTQTCS